MFVGEAERDLRAQFALEMNLAGGERGVIFAFPVDLFFANQRMAFTFLTRHWFLLGNLVAFHIPKMLIGYVVTLV